jgi:hypothetical protein
MKTTPLTRRLKAPRGSGIFNRRGSALVIVLALVVLLTALVIGFLYNSTSGVVTSGRSANTTRADVFGQGAIDSIIGDLKQEIAASANSTKTTYGNTTYYLPIFNANMVAPNMVATPVLPSGMLQTTFPNVIKESVNGLAFSAGDTSNGGAGRASSALTTTASLNNRSVSQSRWNKPLLMVKKTLSNTYDFTPAGGFVAPNWILVNRAGGNPVTAFASNMEAIPAKVGDNTNPVVGRYAYIIYNEGGLLDANVAGYPPSTTVTPVTQSGYKNALAYADLTQLVDSSNNQLLSQNDINAIVGWRNYASAANTPAGVAAGATANPLGNNFPNYTWLAVNGANYFQNMLGNTTGFLRTSTPALVGGQSDKLFLSRQQLIQFLQEVDTAHLANVQNALQYLGTFSRGLSQPSYTPNPNRPVIVGDYTKGGNDGSGGDATINPSFPSITVGTGGWSRNDGTIAVTGEPLVKKRFALSRLAWITYKGPSANRTISGPVQTGADGDIWTLENTYGVSQAWLAQGTATNIQNYFGLVWNVANGTWTYAPQTYTLGSPYSGALLTLGGTSGVASLNSREPNFFELLKAGILAGAIGKDWNNPNDSLSGSAASPVASELNNLENNKALTSVDRSIFQIGANIIDQATVDGYPTVINFSLAAGITQQVAGIKNLPYLYGLRASVLTTTAPDTEPMVPPNYSFTTTTAPTNYGVWVVLQEPELWNPHAWNVNNINSSVGYPAPTSFQITASTNGSAITMQMRSNGFDYSTIPNSLVVNSTLKFNIDATASGVSTTGVSEFREPTLLFVPNVPTGSNLSGTSGTVGTTPGVSQVTAYGLPVLWNGVGPVGYTSGSGPFTYLGFTLSYGAIYFQTGSSGANITYGVMSQAWSESAIQPAIVYTVSCTGPYGSLLNYDTKDCVTPYAVGGSLVVDYTANSGYQRDMISENNVFHFTDPRTSRFGCMYSESGWFNSNSSISPAPRNNGLGWICSQQNVMESQRPDNNAGYGIASYDSALLPMQKLNQGFVWANNVPDGTDDGSDGNAIRLGLFAQNSTAVNDNGIAFQGDAAKNYQAAPQYYTDPDGVVRRGMAGYLPPTLNNPSTTAIGQPLARANTVSAGGIATQVTVGGANTGTIYSRPIVLNRPFRSVGDLGYAFSDTPWKNVDLFTPESGYAGLMDVFCVNDTDNTSGLVAGTVDLNTKQVPVLQAVIAGALEDEYGSLATPTLSSAWAKSIASSLVARTTYQTVNGQAPSASITSAQPLTNVSELVGKALFTSAPAASANGFTADGSSSSNYSGFSADLSSLFSTTTDANFNYIERFRESPIRALGAVGQTRVWNLMIDVVAQTGRYPASATTLDNFVVEGEQRYWVHLAIDRLTGQVIDKQVEVVKE